jgi:exodeoxyribonuclease III
MRLATWNINSLTVRLPQVIDWLQAQQSTEGSAAASGGGAIDVLALQELKLTDDKFPHDAFEKIGYTAQCFGQKTYNGVALLTRVDAPSPASDVVKNIPGFDDDMSRVITATVPSAMGPIRVIGGYFPNGQEPGSEKFEYKMNWLKGLRAWVKAELESHPNLVIMGDYNITFDDADVWDPIGLADTIHCTEEERYHLRALVALGLTDSFRLFSQPAKSYSWWDYRNFGFRRNQGLRIDHILVSSALRPHVTACVIDKTPRKNERPSDHAPVILTLG